MAILKGDRICTIILSCILLLSGCTTGRPDTVNKGTTAAQPTGNAGQEQTAAMQSGEMAQSNSAGEGGATAGNGPDNTNEETTANSGENVSPDIKVKALYLTGWTVGSTAKVNHYIELAKNTEINSYVIDIKDDDGYVGYESQVPEVKNNGTWKGKYDVDKVLKAFHDNGVHIIGRLVAFKDPVYSLKRPDLAIKSVNGGLWKDRNKKTWLNPYNEENWTYIVNIAKEAVEKGFDEIQFDYVRFPSDGRKKDMDFSGITEEKYKAINSFLAYAKSQLPGITVSADVFGIIFESPADTEQIGQYLEHIGKDIDYISPMVYPSHYAYGQIVNKIVFPAPDLQPYSVVYNTLIKGKDRLSKVDGYKAKIRPYLQDFTASWLKPASMYQQYGAKQVREQIKAVYDAGYDEWILWDANNSYDEDALEKEG